MFSGTIKNRLAFFFAIWSFFSFQREIFLFVPISSCATGAEPNASIHSVWFLVCPGHSYFFPLKTPVNLKFQTHSIFESRQKPSFYTNCHCFLFTTTNKWYEYETKIFTNIHMEDFRKLYNFFFHHDFFERHFCLKYEKSYMIQKFFDQHHQ